MQNALPNCAICKLTPTCVITYPTLDSRIVDRSMLPIISNMTFIGPVKVSCHVNAAFSYMGKHKSIDHIHCSN